MEWNRMAKPGVVRWGQRQTYATVTQKIAEMVEITEKMLANWYSAR